MTPYTQFLQRKTKQHVNVGFDVSPDELNRQLMPWQNQVTRWALRKGRAALFEGCGLGKTFQELEWSQQIIARTGQSILIVAPLNVSEQTHYEEAPKFGYMTNLCRSQADVRDGINITNYEMLEHFDVRQFIGVVIDECFPPETLIDTPNGPARICDLKIGDTIFNANGEDVVSDVHRREIESAIRISVKGTQDENDSITSSPNHPYFTQRGWVCAQDLQPGDSLVPTAQAVRMVWSRSRSKDTAGSSETLLQSILLSEMADVSIGCSASSSLSRNGGEAWQEKNGVVPIWQSKSGNRTSEDCRFEPDGTARSSGEGLPHIESHEAQTFRTWWQWDWSHGSSTVHDESIGQSVGNGVRLVVGPTDSRLSNLLQAGLGEFRKANRYRGGWKLSLLAEGERSKEGYEAGFVRVEGLEVLEQGHPDLERYRNAEGHIYFYDIGGTRHPSFSIKGCLVHNSSILKNFTGKVRNQIIETFSQTPYKLACTATPAPNDYMELGNHAEFLGVMTRAEMLSMFFVHDGGETRQWRLKGHAEDKFWKWVCSWAVVIRKPSDIGFSDEGYDLPPINRVAITVPAPSGPVADMLFAVDAKTLTERRTIRRETIDDRVRACAKVVNASKEQFIVWCGLNDESKAATKAISGAVEITGTDPREFKVETMRRFQRGEIRVVVSKLAMFGFGMNLQCCHNWVYLSLSDSFEQMYQGDRRCWRFGQKYLCNCYVVTSELEGAVVRNIERKEHDYEEMNSAMVEHMRFEMNKEVRGATVTTDAHERDRRDGDGWSAILGDSVEELAELPDHSIHYSIFSPPFASLYTYSASERDLGNCSDEEFFEHMGFITDQLVRVIIPGRLVSFHCMNLPTVKERDGYIGIKDFRGDLIRLFQSKGFIYHSEVVIWKDPLVAASRTHVLGLAHKQIVKDASLCRQGIPDYLVTMRAPGANPKPVEHKPRGFDRWVGSGDPPKREKSESARENKYSHEIWQRYASPVWMDINPSDTLQRDSAREEQDERHICPLQLQVIERAVEMWTNPNEIVLSPFMGIGSEGYVSIRAGRQFIGCELKRSYWEQAYRNLTAAVTAFQPSLFSSSEMEVVG